MERIIKDLQQDLRDIVEGKSPRILRKESGDTIDLRALRMVNFSLQWASVGYQSALRFAGMKFGKRMSQAAEARDLSSLLGEIKKLIEGLNNGKVEIEIQSQSKKALLRVYQSALVEGVPNIGQNLCFLEEGFIEGYLDGVIGNRGFLAVPAIGNFDEIAVKETKCQGKGDDFCEFTINLKGQIK